MSDETFQTFLTSGLLVLTASIGYLALSAWRWIDRARAISSSQNPEAFKMRLKGIGVKSSGLL